MEENNLRKKAYNHILGKLKTGTAKAGHRISELKLAKEVGVSRTPVREAIRQLENEGMLQQIPRFGTFVKKLTLMEYQDIWDLRKLLEDYAISRAAIRRSDEDLKNLKSLIGRMRKVAYEAKEMTIQEYYDSNIMSSLDMEFHQLIAIASGNALVVDLRNKNEILGRLITTMPNKGQVIDHIHHVARALREHWRIFCAIRDRDVKKAKYWMNRHMDSSIKRAMQMVDSDLPSNKKRFNYDGYSLEDIERYSNDF